MRKGNQPEKFELFSLCQGQMQQTSFLFVKHTADPAQYTVLTHHIQYLHPCYQPAITSVQWPQLDKAVQKKWSSKLEVVSIHLVGSDQ